MKKTSIFLIILLTAIFACNNPETKEEFHIEGNIEGIENGVISFGQFEDGEFVPEYTTEILDGQFQLKGQIQSPEMYYYSIDDLEGYRGLFLEPSEIRIGLTVENEKMTEAEIEGSASQERYDAYFEEYNKFRDIDQDIYQTYYLPGTENKDEEMIATADSLFEQNEEARNDFIVTYIEDNPDDIVSAYLVLRNSYMFDLEQLQGFLASFDESLDSTDYVKSISERAEILKRTAIGQPIVDFTQADTAGNPVQLSDVIEGKYVLLDFWASWCSPCRKENPNVVAVYQDYKDKGFDVFGISLDKDKEKWIEAIHADDLTWTHVSDLAGWSNTVAEKYGVKSIPHSVLVNPAGIIIDKNLRGEDLRNKVAELLD